MNIPRDLVTLKGSKLKYFYVVNWRNHAWTWYIIVYRLKILRIFDDFRMSKWIVKNQDEKNLEKSYYGSVLTNHPPILLSWLRSDYLPDKEAAVITTSLSIYGAILIPGCFFTIPRIASLLYSVMNDNWEEVPIWITKIICRLVTLFRRGRGTLFCVEGFQKRVFSILFIRIMNIDHHCTWFNLTYRRVFTHTLAALIWAALRRPYFWGCLE